MGRSPEERGAGLFTRSVTHLTRSFLIQQHEVTREEWTKLGLPTSEGRLYPGDVEHRCQEPRCPVDFITFLDALSYANALSRRAGLPECYTLRGCTGEAGLDLRCDAFDLTADSNYECAGYRLPGSAEWEYAARAGTLTAFYGGEWTGQRGCYQEPALDATAWYCFNADKRLHPVMGKAPNGWGLYDVLGNASELIFDRWQTLRSLGDPIVDPWGLAAINGDDTYRVLRSGTIYDPELAHVAFANYGKWTRSEAQPRPTVTGIRRVGILLGARLSGRVNPWGVPSVEGIAPTLSPKGAPR